MDGKQIPIQFTSHKFNETEKRWATPDKEAYAIFYGVKAFEYLLRDVEFTILTDHKNLVYMAQSTTAKVIRWKLALQTFDAYYHYIKGPDNVIPDALSRIINVDDTPESSQNAPVAGCACLSCESGWETPDTAQLCLVQTEHHSPLEHEYHNIETHRWQWDQPTSQWRRSKLQEAQSLPDNESVTLVGKKRKEPKRHHTRKEKRLLKLRASRAKNVPVIVDGEVTRVLPPHERRQIKNLQSHQLPTEVYQLLKRYHNTTAGHHGVEVTLQKLTVDGHSWPYMRPHVHKFIQECPICQKLSLIKPAIHASKYSTVTYEPMERINIDHMGPFPTDTSENIHVLAIVDSFTRWIEFYPVRTTSAEETAECVLKHIGRFGSPLQILSDNGPAFVNEVIKYLTRAMDVEWIFTIAYSKEENAIVERSHRETLRHLRAILNHRKVRSQWSKYLPFVQRIMNAAIKEQLGVSPGRLLFGNALRLDTNILRPPREIDKNDSTGKPLQKWIAEQLMLQQTALEVARETQLEAQTKRFEKIPPVSTTSIPAGSYVLVQDPEGTNKSKLLPLHPGPYEVLSHDKDRYEVRNLVNNGVHAVHISRLRPFKYDSVKTDPYEVALQDNEEFIVEKILEHQGSIQDKTKMRFLVKWQGFSEESNSWEPWYEKGAGLRDNAVLHDYLRERGWGFAIPKSQQRPIDQIKKPTTSAI